MEAFGTAITWIRITMHLEFVVEDSSGAKLVGLLVPRIIGPQGEPHTWHIHPYKGIGRIPRGLKPKGDASKRILLDQLPKILRGYANTPSVDGVVVVIDSDRKDCKAFLAELRGLAEACGRGDTMFRLAIEEVEAWYLGDRAALLGAYEKARHDVLDRYVQDSVCGTWETMADAVYPGGVAAVEKIGWPLPGELKHQWAETIGPLLSIEENRSPSFGKFRDGLRRLVSQEDA